MPWAPTLGGRGASWLSSRLRRRRCLPLQLFRSSRHSWDQLSDLAVSLGSFVQASSNQNSGVMEQQLIAAATSGDAAGIAVALAAAAALEPASLQHALGRALGAACSSGHAGCARQLLSAGADPNFMLRSDQQAHWYPVHRRPIHAAAIAGSASCVQLLLAAGADPCATDSPGSNTALHSAANVEMACLLLNADAMAAEMRNSSGHTPLQAAILQARISVALCLIAEAPLHPATEIQASLRSAIRSLQPGWMGPAAVERQRELGLAIILLAARLGLDVRECSRQCGEHGPLMTSPHLAVWLPALVQRSDAAAGRLMRFLPPPDRQRLRTLALCLGRIERDLTKPLPIPILHRLLAESAVQHALLQPKNYQVWTEPFSWEHGGKDMAKNAALGLVLLPFFAWLSWLAPWLVYAGVVAAMFVELRFPDTAKLLLTSAPALFVGLLVFACGIFLLCTLIDLFMGLFGIPESVWLVVFMYSVLICWYLAKHILGTRP